MECLERAMSAYFGNVQYMYIMMELLSNLLQIGHRDVIELRIKSFDYL